MTKKILIIGKNSYIGSSFINYIQKTDKNFIIDELDARNEKWKEYDFSSYDTILHLAGIAHIKETKKNKYLYYEINRDLAISIAKKSKSEGVRHFIFMSTMSVYGLTEGIINNKTPTNPTNAYGDSKLQAENKIKKLADNEFIISIIRPPMVYGPNSKGNYSTLSKFAKKTNFFPKIVNKRSMLFIDNLSEFLNKIITNVLPGLFFPQNRQFVNTSKMIEEIAILNNNKIIFTSFFNPIIKRVNLTILKKIFGDLIYKKELSNFELNYEVENFEESIKITETMRDD